MGRLDPDHDDPLDGYEDLQREQVAENGSDEVLTNEEVNAIVAAWLTGRR